MSDKTEQATAHRLKQARKDGEVARSADFTDAVSMLFSVLLLAGASDYFADVLKEMISHALAFVQESHDLVHSGQVVWQLTLAGIGLIAACVLTAGVASVATASAQVGFMISMKPVTPRPEAINPAAGLKRMYSAQTVLDFAKMLVKATIVFLTMWQTIRWLFPLIADALYQPLPGLCRILWAVLVRLLLIAALVFVLLGAVDLQLQRVLFARKMKMSKDDVKRERKDQEGDPKLKGERKKLAREMVNSARPKVGSANMIVVNPTHYAVAVRYAPGEHPLPRVIAKGMDEQARMLREAGDAAGVPIISNPPVARALYKVELDAPIPEELFEAIAAILRWLQALARHAGADHDGPSPHRYDVPTPESSVTAMSPRVEPVAAVRAVTSVRPQ